MKNLIAYYRIQVKRMLHHLPAVLLVTVILAGGIGALFFLTLRSGAEEDLQKLTLGIVGDLEGDYLGMGMYALENMDSSRYSVSFTEVASEEEALQKLERGELSAYFVIPDGFMEAIVSGENLPIRMVCGSSQASLQTQLSTDLAEAASAMIIESQAGIYTMQEVYLSEGAYEEMNRDESELNLEYIARILGREKLYQIEAFEAEDDSAMGMYYLCAALVLFWLLWGMNGSSLLWQEDASMGRMLSARGMRAGLQVAAEYLAYETVMLIAWTMLGAAAVCAAVLWAPSESTLILRVFGLMIPAILVIGALHGLIYQAADGLIAGVLILFLVSIVLAFTGGCFYPSALLPKWMGQIGTLLPAGILRNWLHIGLKAETGLMTGITMPAGILVLMGVWLCGMLRVTGLLKRRRQQVCR